MEEESIEDESSETPNETGSEKSESIRLSQLVASETVSGISSPSISFSLEKSLALRSKYILLVTIQCSITY